MNETCSCEPSNGHGPRHGQFQPIVTPRPVGWIPAHDRQGRIDHVAYSSSDTFEEPPLAGLGNHRRKDSLHNAEGAGEFSSNLATRPLAGAENPTCAAVAPGADGAGPRSDAGGRRAEGPPPLPWPQRR